MGTRGAVGFVLDEKEKITYNHFDSYPSGLGCDVLNYLNSIKDFNKLNEHVRNIRLIDEK